jgi:hypothetical protein
MEHYEHEQEARNWKPDETNPRSLKKVRSPGILEQQSLNDAKIAEQKAKLPKLEVGRTLDGMFNSGLFDKVIRYDTALQRQLRGTLKGIADLQQKRFDREKEEGVEKKSLRLLE